MDKRGIQRHIDQAASHPRLQGHDPDRLVLSALGAARYESQEGTDRSDPETISIRFDTLYIVMDVPSCPISQHCPTCGRANSSSRRQTSCLGG